MLFLLFAILGSQSLWAMNLTPMNPDIFLESFQCGNQFEAKSALSYESKGGESPTIVPSITSEIMGEKLPLDQCKNASELGQSLPDAVNKREKRKVHFSPYCNTQISCSIVHINNKSKYTCDACGEKSSEYIQAKNHYLTHHKNPGAFIIDQSDDSSCVTLCPCDFPDCQINATERGLLAHKVKEHATEQACNYCKKRFKSATATRKHINFKHSNLFYRCARCLLILTNKYAYNDHVKNAHNEKIYCPECQSYLKYSSLSAHLVTIHHLSKEDANNYKKTFHRKWTTVAENL